MEPSTLEKQATAGAATRLKDNWERNEQIENAMTSIVAACEDEGRDFNDEENKRYDELKTEHELRKTNICRNEELLQMQAERRRDAGADPDELPGGRAVPPAGGGSGDGVGGDVAGRAASGIGQRSGCRRWHLGKARKIHHGVTICTLVVELRNRGFSIVLCNASPPRGFAAAISRKSRAKAEVAAGRLVEKHFYQSARVVSLENKTLGIEETEVASAIT